MTNFVNTFFINNTQAPRIKTTPTHQASFQLQVISFQPMPAKYPFSSPYSRKIPPSCNIILLIHIKIPLELITLLFTYRSHKQCPLDEPCKINLRSNDPFCQ